MGWSSVLFLDIHSADGLKVATCSLTLLRKKEGLYISPPFNLHKQISFVVFPVCRKAPSVRRQKSRLLGQGEIWEDQFGRLSL
jgi:hypothetical protein